METMTKTIWKIDPTHSEVQFKVKHLVISTVTGTFKSFEGSIESETEDFDGAHASFSLDVDSIDTNVADRDAHLKSDDFFNAEKYPNITFNGILVKTGEDEFKMTGPLTIRESGCTALPPPKTTSARSSKVEQSGRSIQLEGGKM